MTTKLSIPFTAAFALCLAFSPLAQAEEYRLPDPLELQTFSRDAMPFYVAGIAALDRADHGNAYSSLAKAGQLQPQAVRLNQIVAALAMKLGRSKPAAEARGFYETALFSYENILRDPVIDDAFRRHIMNRLRVARDERDNLEQRDARRESIGTYFIQELNRAYTEEARRSDPESIPSGPDPAPAVGQPLPPGQVPFPVLGAPGTAPLVPGVGVPQYPSNVPVPAPVGGPDGFPGPMAPTVPGVPGADPSAPYPGAPAAPPMPAPGPDPNVPI